MGVPANLQPAQGVTNACYVGDSEENLGAKITRNSSASKENGKLSLSEIFRELFRYPFVEKPLVPIKEMTAAEITIEKISILKNIAVISLAFLLLFTAFQSMANLQSSINVEAGLGTYSLSTIYAALILSCMFVPTVMIKHLKCKWTLAVCTLCYSAYIGAQFQPSFGSLIPTAVLLGLGAAPMWSAKCTYLTQAGNRYAALTNNESAEPTIVRFFGFFFMMFQSSQIWGNLISSLVLSTGDDKNGDITNTDICGAGSCPLPAPVNASTEPIVSPITKEQRYIMAGIFLTCALSSSVIIVLLVDSLSRFGENEREGSSTGKSGVQLLVATFRHMQHPYQLLIIPLTIWSGFEQAFISADYSRAFITCSLGVQNVGYVFICYGVCDALGSVGCGALVKILGRVPIFIFGGALNVALIITFLTWYPDPEQPGTFYALAALWGLGDSIWQTQINAFYGIIFKNHEEAAFSNYRLWESLGFVIAYIYANLLCVETKLYIILAMLVAGMTGYLIIEIQELKKARVVGESDSATKSST